MAAPGTTRSTAATQRLPGGRPGRRPAGRRDGTNTAGYDDATVGVTANLANPAQNTGDASGDTYVNIQNLTGSSFNDILIGNASANVLSGGDGDDQLFGGAGNDTLNGGNSNDILAGGPGADALDGAAAS
jgi:Ca2+-binding RTX toxin-like protein